MKKILILLLMGVNFLFCSESIFDSIDWIKVLDKKGTILYMQQNKNEKTNFYKAEKILNFCSNEKFYNSLMDFESYPKIFPRTVVFKKVKEVGVNKYLVYSLVSFNPMKNRDYYILLENNFTEYDNKKEWVLEWSPVDSSYNGLPENDKAVRVKNIYGRWKISELDGKIKISVEYYNDFNLNISNKITSGFEKNSTIDALNNLIDYALKMK